MRDWLRVRSSRCLSLLPWRGDGDRHLFLRNTSQSLSDRQRRDGPPQLVVRRKHPVIPMPMLPRRRDEIGQTVQELKRSEFDDAIGPGRVDLRPRPGPTQLAALCLGST